MPSIKKSELISPLQRLSIIIPFFLYFFFKRNYREPEKLANRDCARGGKRKRRRRKIKIFGYFFFFFSSPTVGGRLLALLAGPHPRREWVSAGDTDRWPMDQSTRRSLSLALVALASRLRRRHDPPESPPTQKEKKSPPQTRTHTQTQHNPIHSVKQVLRTLLFFCIGHQGKMSCWWLTRNNPLLLTLPENSFSFRRKVWLPMKIAHY